MRCRKARNLLELTVEEPLDARRDRFLLNHLNACPACRAYQQRLRLLSEAIPADAEMVSQCNPSPHFQDRLHSALLGEARSRRLTPAERLSRVLSGTMRVPALGRAVNAAVLCAAAVWLALALLSTPQPRPVECQFGHIASLSVKRLPDGRVVADLSDRNTPARACLRQERRP